MQISDIFMIVVGVVAALYLMSCVKVLKEYERGVIFRLGRILTGTKGPGILLVFRPIDRMARVDLRQRVVEVSKETLATNDKSPVRVSARVLWRVVDPHLAVLQVGNYVWQTGQLAEKTLRSMLVQTDLNELLEKRDQVAARIQAAIEPQTLPYGVKITAVEITEIDLPVEWRSVTRTSA